MAMVAWNNFEIGKCLQHDHVDILFQADLFGMVMQRKNLPIVSAVHGIGHWFFTTSRSTAIYFRTVYRRMLDISDRLIAISNSTFADLVQTWHMPASKIRLVYNGVDQDFYSPQNDMASSIAELGVIPPYVLYSGTSNSRKNVTTMIEAWSRLLDSYPSHQLVLAGVGQDETLMGLIASKPNMVNRVLMLKHLPNDVMPYLCTGCDVFAFPSLYEGHSLALLEAMACGCPILTSNFGSMLETVGNTAVCVNTYDVQCIAEGLDRLLSNPDLREKLGAAAQERVRRWTPKNCAEGTLKILEDTWRNR
jgi:glycosyltransferase involved in cell wall biosynthesis